MKTFSATGFFALIVAILISFTAYDYWSSQKKEALKDSEAKIVQLKKDDITTIEVSGAKDSFRLEKTAGKWRIAKPFSESADQQAVFSYLDSLSGERSAQTVKEGNIDLHAYGLAPAQFTLKLEAGEKSQTIMIGTLRAYDSSLYGQVDNAKKVLLLSSSWDVLMTKPASDFRDTKLYQGVVKTEFDTITVTGKLANFEIVREPGDSKVYKLKASQPTDNIYLPAVQAWLEQIKALRGAAFVEAPNGDLQPDYKIVLKRAGVAPYILIIARDKLHPAQFEATSTDLPGAMKSRVLLGKSAADAVMVRTDVFYNKKAPFDFKLSGVTHLKFHDAKSARNFDSSVDPAHPDVLLAKLAALEAVRFLGAVNAEMRAKKFPSYLRLSNADGSLAFEMSWGAPVIEKATLETPESRYLPVITNLSKQVIGVPENQIASLGAQPEETSGEPSGEKSGEKSQDPATKEAR